jgi:hypothetical protein
MLVLDRLDPFVLLSAGEWIVQLSHKLLHGKEFGKFLINRSI